MPQDSAKPNVVELTTPRAGAPEGRPRPPAPGDISVDEVVRTILTEWRTFVAVAVAVLLLSVGYAILAAPVYEADAVVRVQARPLTLTRVDEGEASPGEQSGAEVEIEVLRSRRLVGLVVDQLQLDVEATPRRFPVLGSAVARRHRGPEPAGAWLGLEGFAWGGERLRVARLEVSEDLVDEPMELTALAGGRYRLSAGAGEIVLEAGVGELIGSTGQQRVEISVAELVARPGTRFTVVKQRRDRVIDQLRSALQAEERGRKTGVVVVRLEGRDPARVAAVLAALAEAYLRADVERRAAEAQLALDFLEAQLPGLKAELTRAEAALRAFQAANGAVSLSGETESIVSRSAEVERGLSMLEQERTEARGRFTEAHPQVVAIGEKIARLRKERAALEGRLRVLPATELEAARLTRDVKAASDLYLPLLAKSQELRVVRAGIVGSASIVDPPGRPYEPAGPKKGLVLTLGLVLGLGGGAAAAMARRTWGGAARDADEIESATGLPVYAGIPHSARQEELEGEARRKPCGPLRPLSALAPDDPAVEQLRTLRTMLHFALVEASTKVVAVSSPTPGAGKSFVCSNLAYLLASSGWRVLLVDADLRRGRLHRHFGLGREPGLSDLVAGMVTPADAVRTTPFRNLWLLPSGKVPPHPAELLQSRSFQAALADASNRFDLVIVDCPPVLVVTDPVLVAWNAGLTLLVLRSGQLPISDIQRALKHFGQSGVRVSGTILNGLRPGRDRYGSGRHYEYPT